MKCLMKYPWVKLRAAGVLGKQVIKKTVVVEVFRDGDFELALVCCTGTETDDGQHQEE